ncbi:MAG: class I SAM-dependent methyltransferase [Chitinophagaceae bacterium]|nr:class I SAM-dependent methyltransferase [Chitinophagaceae bacterium]
MTSKEALALIDKVKLPDNGPARWADLGCGSGLFTRAIAALLPAGSTVFGIDTDPGINNQNVDDVEIKTVKSDFSKDFSVDELDGIIMANSLHYIKNKPEFVQNLKTTLKPGATVIIVEYDTDKPVSHWVPYPISHRKLVDLFYEAQYGTITKLGERKSKYQSGSIYAVSIAV